MCSDNAETHPDVKLQEIQAIKKEGIHAFHELEAIVSSICQDILDNTIVPQSALHRAHRRKKL